MTVNAGLRWDSLSEQVTGMPAQPGTFAIIPAFGNIMMPKQTNWSPRVSVVFDLFGNGKTALRAGFNRFPNAATTGLAAGQDPANGANVTALLPWTDANTDNIVQYSVSHDASGQVVGCVYQTPGCELDFSKLVSNFGTVTLSNHVDPNLKRPSYNQTNIGLQHELAHGVSMTVEWFRTQNNDAQTTQNLNRVLPGGTTDPSLNPNFKAVTVFSPIDGHAITVYDVATTAINVLAPNNQVFTDTKQSTVYNGFDLGVNMRLPRGARLFGGTTTERTIANTCDLGAYNPNSLLYCDTSTVGIPWRTQLKLSGTMPLGWGMTASGALQALPGYVEANTLYTITKNTTYTVCPGNSAAAGCVVNAKIDGSQVTSSHQPCRSTRPARRSRRARTRWTSASSKRVMIGHLRIDPKIDLFNAFNSSAYFTVRSTAFSPIVGTGGHVRSRAAGAGRRRDLSRTSVLRAACCRAGSFDWALTSPGRVHRFIRASGRRYGRIAR